MFKASKITTRQLLLSSFEHRALLLKRLKPSIRREQLWLNIHENALCILENIDVFSVNCDYRFLQKEQALKLKQAANQIHYYTIKDSAFMESLRPLHVDNIMTD